MLLECSLKSKKMQKKVYFWGQEEMVAQQNKCMPFNQEIQVQVKAFNSWHNVKSCSFYGLLWD